MEKIEQKNNGLSKKDLFIKGQMGHIKDDVFFDILQKIKNIDTLCRFRNNKSNKFNVWVFQSLNDISMKCGVDMTTAFSEHQNDIKTILNWAYKESPNITSLTFEQALKESKQWVKQHPELFLDIDESRIVFKSDCGYFFYLLSEKDLLFEGQHMGHCVGDDSYKKKIKSKKALIVSLRDTNNKPHVTIEISVYKDKKTKQFKTHLVQQHGKQNLPIRLIYQEIINEFVCFMCDKIQAN